jgi:hypothetical protein
VLLALGVLILGFACLLGAVLCWVAFFRNRRRGGLPVAPVHRLRWAVTFTVLGRWAASRFGRFFRRGMSALSGRAADDLRGKRE